MAEPPPPAPTAQPAATPTVPSRPPNPALRMLGLPNIRPRLPSRNWLIFLSLTSSLTAAILYDKSQVRRRRQAWCDLVSHIPSEPLDVNALPRRVRIFISAPPGDGIGSARELFYEYVKPVLAAGGLEWDVIEARREGEVRFAVAEAVRKRRRGRGEGDAVEEMRERSGVRREGVQGDLVLGRHALREWVRGVHEGWLGPLERPDGVDGWVGKSKIGVAVPAELRVEEEEEEVKEGEEKKQKEPTDWDKLVFRPDPYIPTEHYADAQLPGDAPTEMEPVGIVKFPHILGFFNTGIRMWRFLNRRHLADEIGRETAAVVLGTHTRAMENGERAGESEVESALVGEEQEWHKSVRRREKEEGKEDIYKDSIVLDNRIYERMRRFVLSDEDERKVEAFRVKPKTIEVNEDN